MFDCNSREKLHWLNVKIIANDIMNHDRKAIVLICM